MKGFEYLRSHIASLFIFISFRLYCYAISSAVVIWLLFGFWFTLLSLSILVEPNIEVVFSELSAV